MDNETGNILWEFWEHVKEHPDLVLKFVDETQDKLDALAAEEARQRQNWTPPQKGDFVPQVWTDRIVDGKLVSQIVPSLVGE